MKAKRSTGSIERSAGTVGQCHHKLKIYFHCKELIQSQEDKSDAGTHLSASQILRELKFP